MKLNPHIHQEIQARLKLSSGNYSVFEFEGFTSVNKPYKFNITFVSNESISIEDIVDASIELHIIDIKRPLISKSIFGMIFKASEDSVVGNKYMYKIELVSPTHYMGLNTSYEIFLDKKVPDIIREVVNRYAPLLNIKLDMKIDTNKAPIRQYTTRYNQSSLEFITMLCENEGYSLIMDSSLSDPYKITLSELNDHVQVYKEPLSADFNKSKQFSSSHFINNFYDQDKPSLDMETSIGKSIQSSMGDNSITSQLRNDIQNYTHKDTLNILDESLFKDLKRYTNNDSLQGFKESFRVYGTSSELNINDSILVTLHDEKRLRECEVITLEVKFYGKFPNALDEFINTTHQQSIQFHTTFEAIPSDIIYKPLKTIQKPKVSGTLTAIVSKGKPNPNENINEIDVDEEGRIKVLFAFEENKTTSTYLKMMQVSAGDNYGFMFLPRVNTEVLVGFKNGDLDEPFILKSLANGENKHPYPLPRHKTKSFIRTTSYPAYEDRLGYNEMLFEDKQESELFSLRAQRDYEIYAKNNYSKKVDNNSHKTTTNKDTTIKHNFTQTVGDTNNRTIKANDIKTVQKEEVHTIKENRTQNIKKDFTTIVQGNKNSYIEEDLIDEIKEVLHTYIEGDVTDKYLESFFIQVGDAMGVDITNSLHIDTSSVKQESATTAQIETTDGISLKCGGNILTVDASGIHFNTACYLDNSGNDGVVAGGVKIVGGRIMQGVNREQD